MKFYTIILVLLLITFSSLAIIFLLLKNKNYNRDHYLHRIKYILRFAIVLLALFYAFPFPYQYSLSEEQYFFSRKNIPQVSDEMKLYEGNSRISHYISFSRNQIRHSEKIVDYDLFSVHSVTDKFINDHYKLGLEIIHYNQFWRKSRTEYYLIDNVSEEKTQISAMEFNSYLVDWGIRK